MVMDAENSVDGLTNKETITDELNKHYRLSDMCEDNIVLTAVMRRVETNIICKRRCSSEKCLEQKGEEEPWPAE